MTDHTIDAVEGATSADPSGGLTFTCPRCGDDVVERFYGPCDACRSQLRAELGTASREVEAAEYEPKMNVTPNAIATKD